MGFGTFGVSESGRLTLMTVLGGCRNRNKYAKFTMKEKGASRPMAI